MAGTKAGARKGIEAKLKKYGDDFFVKAGAKGGRPKGFEVTEETKRKIIETKQAKRKESGEDNQTPAE